MDSKAISYPSEVADKYVVRFPDGMRDRLKAAASENHRSMNAEIIARLQASFGHADSDLARPLRIDEVLAEMARLSALFEELRGYLAASSKGETA